MPFFSEETLQAVRSIPLYEIVRPVVDLSRSGRNWKGLSPFTQEKTPSFFVLTDKNIFKCHSSGLAGDGIRFVQETEKLTFPEAVETLAERFSIPVRYADGKGPDPEVRSLRQALLDIHEYARDFYHQAFMADSETAAAVRRYWQEERGFSMELAREFHIGLAAPDSCQLLTRLLDKGFSRQALAQSGLFHTGHGEREPRDWFTVFRGRLMIPIRNLQGQVVAFTARQLDITPRDHPSWKAKYINSPETPVFKKGRLLFNLDRAREAVSDAGRMLLVEGQLDALRSWDSGLREAIAPQGTSITEEQLDLVKRYTDRLDVLLDQDEAGKRAILRLLPMAFAKRLQVTVISLPEGKDPDDFLRHKGAAGLESLTRESGIRFAGRFHLPADKPSPEDRSRALQELFTILESCPSAVVREGYLEEAITVTGASTEAGQTDFQRFFRGRSGPSYPQVKKNSEKSGTNPPETLTNLEGDLLWAVLKNVPWAELLAQVIDHQWIKSETCEGKILSRVLAQATVDHIEDSDGIFLLLESDEERNCFHHYLCEDRPHLEMLTFVNETIAALARRYCRQRISQIEGEITRRAVSADSHGDLRDLIQEKSELIRHHAKGPFPAISVPD